MAKRSRSSVWNYFKKIEDSESVKSSEKLKEVQKQLNVSDHKLVQEVSTRWNSTYLMFTRIHEQFEAITTALCLLGQNHLCLKNEDKELISNCLIVLKPFLEATENISGDKYVSVSMIIPLVKLLLESMKSHLSTLPLAANISAELASRFSSIEGAYVTAATTLLDPRFKKLPFSSPTASDFAVSRIRNEVARLIPSETTEATENSSEACTQSLWDSFDKQAVESTAHRTAGTEAIIEVRRYFEEPIIPRSSNPLLWWKENQHRFPRLMQIAKKYLCIPGSSVPSERLFSKAGQLVSERRNRLKPKNIDLLLFLNNNL
ncbi:PREDICTED: zinc finger BED domain-containing protein 1-like [Amphimedon queenslandica]|uniref:HAT C-terminal dimerisation domain-containing protein n=1 Tax=Amphimedon queenslandica TaxID=400682 RepID=A0AAN0IRK1_AMPQE|nr:PREDICTED: zinc finger BED domain-containing protein 1-like [Amphimedon queenslandica]|eukprot:XP_011408502.2 PREDICTED: zinc finger BED domain-containing protein 1-like [Amphimedon queenslandica]